MSDVPPFRGDNRPVSLGRTHDKAPAWGAGLRSKEGEGIPALHRGPGDYSSALIRGALPRIDARKWCERDAKISRTKDVWINRVNGPCY